MEEQIFNIYLIIHDGFIENIGVIDYSVSGSDNEKMKFLQSNVEKNLNKMKLFPIPSKYFFNNNGTMDNGKLRYEAYLKLANFGKIHELFTEIYEFYDTARDPFFCITPFVDGKIKIDATDTFKINTNEYSRIEIHETPHFYEKYSDETTFHVLDLINDDFIKPIELLGEQKFYLQALKLLVSAIDTFAFLEHDDVSGNFNSWLNSYVELSDINVKPEEIWELRNALLHTTSYRSRKVKKSKVAQLVVSVGPTPKYITNQNKLLKTLPYSLFFSKVKDGLKLWLQEVSLSEDKRKEFIKRYEVIVSDFRTDSLYAY